ncbi:unnamed protein product [Vicia faba]|uniref:DNA helicase n=1 Tax=Vicia faba TaxID=3906 RepID=A0AAV0YMS6_VICFA|nr:unnamed protein product [Vicia faba]
MWPYLQTMEQDVLDISTLTDYVSYARKRIHPQLSDEADDELITDFVKIRGNNNNSEAGSFLHRNIDKDLITSDVSASERIRRKSLIQDTRNLIMEKMQIEGRSMHLLEILEELKNQSPGNEIHLNDVSPFPFSTLANEGCLSMAGDSVKRT